jgi:4-carboxymuconolactone decarboxylase
MSAPAVRLAPLAPPYEAKVAEHLEKLMPPGRAPLALFRTVAHNPRVLGRLRRGGLLDPGSIRLREREILILRTTARLGAEYEWGVHVAFFAAAAGLSAEHLAATVHGGAGDALWSPDEQLLLAVCDALCEHAHVPDELFTRLALRYQPAQIVEIVALCGQYHMVSFLIDASALPLEPDAPRFPPPRL